jgi:hypothetical protein
MLPPIKCEASDTMAEKTRINIKINFLTNCNAVNYFIRKAWHRLFHYTIIRKIRAKIKPFNYPDQFIGAY